jgi:hypothetical protein
VGISILAVGARLPTISGQREFVDAGSLISYGPNFPDLFRRAGDFVNKILRGAKPADLPIEQPTKFDLVVNLTTAKALGLTIPQSLLAVADEVIESHRLSLHCTMSASGTKRTSHCLPAMSAFGGKADMAISECLSAFDPKRT